MYIVVNDEELKRLAKGETVLVVRRSSREGTVSVYDGDGCHVGTGFLTRVGKLKTRRMLVEQEDGEALIPVKEFCDDESFLKRVLRARSGGGAVFIHRLEPIKIRNGVGRMRWIGKVAKAKA